MKDIMTLIDYADDSRVYAKIERAKLKPFRIFITDDYNLCGVPTMYNKDEYPSVDKSTFANKTINDISAKEYCEKRIKEISNVEQYNYLTHIHSTQKTNERKPVPSIGYIEILAKKNEDTYKKRYTYEKELNQTNTYITKT